MSFLTLVPWLAWTVIGLAVALTAAVFVIRPRRRSVVVPSLIIWQRVLGQSHPPSIWSRLRWIVSLLLSLIIAALVALALAGPVPRGTASSTQRTLVVLDSSWSMGARTVAGETRWERARARARTLITSASGEVALATTAHGVIAGPTADRVVLLSALDDAVPSAGADRGWPGVAAVDAAHFVTDGAVPHTLPDGVRVHSVFEPASNVAIAAFEVVPSAHSVDAAEIFLSVVNHATISRDVQVTVTRAGSPIATRVLDLAAGGRHRESMAVPRSGDGRFGIHVTAADDALAIDDEAAAWLATAEPLRVVIVAGASSPLPALLTTDTSLRVTTVESVGYAQATADVWVFDGWLPPQAPGAPALIIDPPASTWFGPRAAEELRPAWPVGGAHALLEGVDSTFLHLDAVHTFTRPSLQPVAVSAAGTPLVSIEESSAGRYVVFGFSSEASNLTSAPSFPVLIGNAIDWLGRPERHMRREAGAMVLPVSTTRVSAPDGRDLPIAMRDGRVTARLDAPGLYLIESAGARRVVRIGLDDPRRSNLLTSAIPVGDSEPAAPAGAERPWTRGIALVALVLVALEWVTWRRRITV